VAGLLDEEAELAGAEEPEAPAAVVAAGAAAEPLELFAALDALSEPVEADEAALSAAVTAGAGSLVLVVPLSAPPLLRKSVTYQPEPLS
jgi:hypothetical protein